jgi:hypothetical protein
MSVLSGFSKAAFDGNLSHMNPASAMRLQRHLRAQTAKGIILIIN